MSLSPLLDELYYPFYKNLMYDTLPLDFMTEEAEPL